MVNGFLDVRRQKPKKNRRGTPLDRGGDVRKHSRHAPMLILRGSPALSPFRLQKLCQDLTTAGLPVESLSAEFVHVVDLAADLAPHFAVSVELARAVGDDTLADALVAPAVHYLCEAGDRAMDLDVEIELLERTVRSETMYSRTGELK